MTVLIGSVETFPGARSDKEQALKVLEEAAEVFGAWQVLYQWSDDAATADFDAGDVETMREALGVVE